MASSPPHSVPALELGTKATDPPSDPDSSQPEQAEQPASGLRSLLHWRSVYQIRFDAEEEGTTGASATSGLRSSSFYSHGEAVTIRHERRGTDVRLKRTISYLVLPSWQQIDGPKLEQLRDYDSPAITSSSGSSSPCGSPSFSSTGWSLLTQRKSAAASQVIGGSSSNSNNNNIIRYTCTSTNAHQHCGTTAHLAGRSARAEEARVASNIIIVCTPQFVNVSRLRRNSQRVPYVIRLPRSRHLEQLDHQETS